jgi:transposase-like protein
MTESIEKKIAKNPEVVEKATRRRFTTEYKERIATEAEQCSKPGELGSLLRREGLYSSTVQRWRRQLQGSSMSPSKKPTRTESPSQEIARLKRQNERLTEKVRQAELIIEVQKKVSELIQTRSPEKPG